MSHESASIEYNSIITQGADPESSPVDVKIRRKSNVKIC